MQIRPQDQQNFLLLIQAILVELETGEAVRIAMILWYLWHHRNLVVHEGRINYTPRALVENASEHLAEFQQARAPNLANPGHRTNLKQAKSLGSSSTRDVVHSSHLPQH